MTGASFRVRVTRWQEPSPEREPTFRGAGLLAVPGDHVAVETQAGVIRGELVHGLIADGGETADTPLMLATEEDCWFLVEPRQARVVAYCMAPHHDHCPIEFEAQLEMLMGGRQ